MKKKWLSVLALSMSICTTVTTFAGCDFGNMFGGGKLTEDQIYEKVVEAKEATENYKGAMTITQNYENNSPQGISKGIQKVTADPQTNRYYSKTQSGANESSWDYESVDKTFKQGESYYLYTKSNTKEEYYNLTLDQAKTRVENTLISTTIDEFDDYIEEIPSIKKMNDAYAEVVVDSKALVAEYYQQEEMQLDASVLYECKQEQKSYIFKKATMMYMAQGTQDRRVIQEVEFTAVNGLITEVSTYQKESQATYETATRETVSQEASIEITRSYTLEYKFAESDYNAVETEPTSVKPNIVLRFRNEYTKAVELNGVLFEQEHIFSGYGYEEVLGNILNGAGFNGLNIVWYTDKACTKPLTATMTEEEFEKLDTLYGQATVKADYYSAVLYIEEGVYASDVNDNYKLVFDDIENADGNIFSYMEEINNYSVLNRTGYTVYVNGTKVVFADGEVSKDIPLTEGQICVVKYVKTYEKKELNVLKQGFGF